MAKIVWDKISEHLYETGVEQGTLYKQVDGAYPLGVAWNGLSKVTESPSGAEPNPIYADNRKYLNLISAEEFAATIEAYTYPDEFAECDGSAQLGGAGVSIGQQTRKPFGLVYKTKIGNDVSGSDYGYKLHIIYGAMAAPSSKDYETINETPNAVALSWELSTTPVEVTGKKPTASITVDSTKADPTKLAALENILFGTAVTDPRLPLPDEINTLFAEAAPSAVALSSIVPDDEADNVAVDANIVMTFNNAILKESITVVSAAGAIIDGAKSWDATGKILTFNPTDNLTNNTSYTVVIAGVVDIYAQSLAAAAKNFTTVA